MPSELLFYSRKQVKREDEALHEGELPPKDLERAEAAMRALIRIFLLLDFALVGSSSPASPKIYLNRISHPDVAREEAF